MASLIPRLLLAALLAGGTATAQEVYVWIDGNGNPAYGDTPPPGADAQPVSIRYQRTDRQSMDERMQRQAELDAAARLREDQQAELSAGEESERLETIRQAEANCQQARETLSRYETAQRLFRPLPDGEREYLTDDELDAERAAARRAVDQWCNPRRAGG